MILPILYKDFYKADHRRQYPNGTNLIYSNMTARDTRIKGIDKIVVFGIQYFIKEYLVKRFNDGFFGKPKDTVIKQYKRRMDTSLGVDIINTNHIANLHDLGYLPLRIKSLQEGTLCPIRVPMLTICNTHNDFFWLTNFIETLVSNVLWHPMTSATIAFAYRKLLNEYAYMTSDSQDFVQWQGHDFSMRGHSSLESALASGAAHLLSFRGSDTIPAIDWLEQYYNANSEIELIGGSVCATEHSVMCMGGEVTEIDTYKRLLTEVYPNGIVSIVSDTWNYWKILTETLPQIKSSIMRRDGKLVIRPDSGDPIKIICGDRENRSQDSPEWKGTLQILWEIFGGDYNSKGYKQLNQHIGCIYGDSITLAICGEINRQLEIQGFASTNMVYGIGSYTYQYVTRDTFGFAVKSTYGEVSGSPRELIKTPKTDNGIKHSAKGLLRVNEDLSLSESVSKENEKTGLLQIVFEDGVLQKETSLKQIRDKLMSQLPR